MTSSQSSADCSDLTFDERLAAVKAAGRRRRARRLRLRSAAAGVLAIALAGGVAVWPQNAATVRTELAADATTSTTRRTQVLGTVIERPAGDSTTTTEPMAPAEPTASIAPEAPALPSSAPAPASSPAPTRVAPPTTAPGPCQTGPECGSFRWEPAAPPDEPLLLEHDPVGPAVVGQPITITVRWSDADARLTWIDDDTDDVLLGESCRNAPRYGPWALPPADGGSGAHTITFTPSIAGTTTVEVYAASGTCDGYDPYHSSAGLLVTVEVAAAESP